MNNSTRAHGLQVAVQQYRVICLPGWMRGCSAGSLASGVLVVARVELRAGRLRV